jgi:hypothetical protein
MAVIIFVDGVMRKPRDQSIIIEGTALYKSLNEIQRVLLIAEDKEKTDIWLKMNNLAKKIDDIVPLSKTVVSNKALDTVLSIRSKGKVDFVVTEDSDLAKLLLEQGIPVLVFLNPRYARPEFRPDGRAGKKSWDEITNELDKQQGLYNEDRRIREEESIEDYTVEDMS